jgi:hypothetical protein
MRTVWVLGGVFWLWGLSAPLSGQTFQEDLRRRVGTLRDSVARNQAALRSYTWTSQTQVLYKGDVKQTRNEVCRYGSEGKVQKTLLPSPPPEEKHGLRGHIAEKKGKELKSDMEKAVALVQNYVPPSPEKLEMLFQAGSASTGETESGAVQLHFKGYFKLDDALVCSFDSLAQVLRKINVNSYLDTKNDAVTLQVLFDTLPDGTNYISATTLAVPTKDLVVWIRNQDYQKLAQ